MNITWIASYPKSGNTWMRFMIYAAIYGPPKNSIDVTRKIPDIHRKLPIEPPEDGSMFAKTHLQLTDKHPKLDQTLRAIHIIRNPRDILLSALNYRQLTGEGAWSLTKKSYAKSFLKIGGDADWKKLGFGTWATHARSWRNTDRFPVLALRYEDLKADPKSELVKILDFVGVTKTDEEIRQAIVASSFDSMRALEIREKHNTKPTDHSKQFFVGTKSATRKGLYFMNKGKSNQSLEEIGSGLDNEFQAALKDDLAEFGYSS